MDIDDVKTTEQHNVVIKWTLEWEREKTPKFQSLKEPIEISV